MIPSAAGWLALVVSLSTTNATARAALTCEAQEVANAAGNANLAKINATDDPVYGAYEELAADDT